MEDRAALVDRGAGIKDTGNIISVRIHLACKRETSGVCPDRSAALPLLAFRLAVCEVAVYNFKGCLIVIGIRRREFDLHSAAVIGNTVPEVAVFNSDGIDSNASII